MYYTSTCCNGSGVSIPHSDDVLNKDITIEELCSCIKRLKRGKSPGIDGILPDMIMIKDGGELVKQSLLWLFNINCMLAGHFPERLSVGLITAVYKSDMSNYRGITVGSVIAKLFAMILEQRTASWAEDHAVDIPIV